jgi:hypothetical protein
MNYYKKHGKLTVGCIKFGEKKQILQLWLVQECKQKLFSEQICDVFLFGQVFFNF